jgi:hypothetical protein
LTSSRLTIHEHCTYYLNSGVTNLQSTANQFDKALTGLQQGDIELGLSKINSKRIKRQLDKVQSLWDAFYPTIKAITASGEVSSDQLNLVVEGNIELLKQMNKAVSLFEKEATKSGLNNIPQLASVINLAGKQRMLSQKMSKEYFLLALGHDVDTNKLNLLETYTLFDRTLVGLIKGDDTLGLPATKQQHIKDQVATVSRLWSEFKPLMEFAANPNTISIPKEGIDKVAKDNLPLLQEVDKAVNLYEKEVVN